MFCRECGKKVEDGNKYCTGCGAKIEPIKMDKKVDVDESNKSQEVNEGNKAQDVTNASTPNQTTNELKKDKISIGFNILSFFVPIVGLILFLVYRKETPRRANAIGICAIIGYVLSIVARILLGICLNIFFLKENITNRPNNYRYEYQYRYNNRYNI